MDVPRSVITFDAVIWDFDGTILDTEWPAWEAAEAEYRRFGVEPEWEWWRSTIGSSDHQPWWERLAEQLGELPEPEEVIVERWRHNKRAITNSATPLPGVAARLDHCHAAGVRCAVASSSPSSWVEPHLERLGLRTYFAAISTATDVGPGRTKPEPDLFLLAAERLDVDPSRCVVIEDSPHGVEAARRAGMASIAVPNRLTVGGDFRPASLVVDTVDDPRVLEMLALGPTP